MIRDMHTKHVERKGGGRIRRERGGERRGRGRIRRERGGERSWEEEEGEKER